MRIEPYKSIDNFEFGRSIEDAIKHFGNPVKIEGVPGEHAELHYALFILRFDSVTNCFREFSGMPACPLTFLEKQVHWDISFIEELAQQDELFDLYGFIVSFKFGLSLSGFHDGDESGKAIHVFRKGDWDEFLDDRAKPYKMNPRANQ